MLSLCYNELYFQSKKIHRQRAPYHWKKTVSHIRSSWVRPMKP